MADPDPRKDGAVQVTMISCAQGKVTERVAWLVLREKPPKKKRARSPRVRHYWTVPE